MGASGSSANKGVQGGLKAEYDASLTLFNAGEQNELQESFEAICSTKAEEKTYEASYKGFTFTQLEVCSFLIHIFQPSGCFHLTYLQLVCDVPLGNELEGVHAMVMSRPKE